MLKCFIFVFVFAITLAAPISLFSQAPDAKRAEKARQVKEKIGKLGTGRSVVVKVKLYNDTEYKGYVTRSGDADFEVTDVGGNPHTIAYTDVRSIGGKNMSTGAKIAIGVGIGAGITLLILLLIIEHYG